MKARQVKIQKITAHIPQELLQAALKATHKGITETLKIALEEMARKKVYENIERHRGKVKFSIDFNKLRDDE